MAVDKDFVIKNGLEVNEDLLYADTDTDRVGIGITTPAVKLDVIGDTSISGIASVGIALSTHDAEMTGFTTSFDGLHVGSGGTALAVNALNKKVGINSAIPQYTADIIGPVSTGTTAAYIYGDLEVTGNIKAVDIEGQITDGGSVGFSTLTVNKKLVAPQSDVYTVFNVESVGGTQWRYLVGGSEPTGIGFTENTINPEIFLMRGQNYRFNVNASGNPFYIKKDQEPNLSQQYNDGVENNGAQVGIITFKVPHNSPDILFYQASNQSGMSGRINVVGGGFTGTTAQLDVVGVATITQADITYLNVTGFSTLGGSGASATQLEVTGVSTLSSIISNGIDVGSGIVTASLFVGVSTGTNNVQIEERNNNQNYQVGFITANGTGYQGVFIDSDDSDFTYNPSTKTLSVANIIGGNIAGVSENVNNIKVDERNDNVEYQVGFITANGNSFQRVYIDQNNTNFTYNPSTHTLTASTFVGNLSGTATNATNINTQNDSTNSNQFPVFVASAADGTDNRPRVDSQFTYNPSTNTLTAGNLAGAGDNLTNLNASNLSQGTIPGARGVTAGSVDSSFVRYNGNTKSNGQFYGGNGNPTNTTRLNYDGQFHATGFTAGSSNFSGNGSGLTNLNASALSSGTIPGARGVSATTSTDSFVRFRGNTKATGEFYSGNSNPTNTTRLNYDGQLYATGFTAGSSNFSGNGSGLTNLNASALSSGTIPGARGVTAGSNTSSFIEYNGNTKANGQFYSGTSDPTESTRLNFDGAIHATTFVGNFSGSSASSSKILVTNNNTDTGKLLFATGTGNQSILRDDDLTYNASSNKLTISSGTINCPGDGSNFGNTSLDATTVESLTVTDSTASTSNSTGAITCSGGVGIAGALNVGGDITAFATSDERLKDNIEPIPNALLKMKKISGNTFDWNEESGKEGSECGVIAQEIESLGLPGLVTTRENGYKAVRYEKLVPLLIEAIKELTERVQELEK